MPPRCLVPGTSSGLRPVASSADGIWITDAMLAHAVERYSRVSSLPSRALSSCPGPIESRRRLGKRHMTAHIPVSPPTFQPWPIELPFPIGEWKWEAPTLVQDRLRRSKKLSPSRLLYRFIDWLEDYGDDATAITATPSTTAGLDSLMADLERRILATNVDDMKRLHACVRLFNMEIQDLIRQRKISSANLITTLDPFTSAARLHINNDQAVSGMVIRLGMTVLKAIGENRDSAQRDAYTDAFWHSCVNILDKAKDHRLVLDYYILLADNLPPHLKHLLTAEHLLNLGRQHLLAARRTLGHHLETWFTQQRIFARVLERLTPDQLQGLWADMEAFASAPCVPEPFFRSVNLRYAFYLTQAFNKGCDFAGLIHRINKTFLPFMSKDRVFKIVQARLWEQSCIRPEHVELFAQLDTREPDWDFLQATIQYEDAEVKKKAMEIIFDCVFGLGHPHWTLMQLRHTPKFGELCTDVAHELGDHRKALRLWVNLVRIKHLKRPHANWGLEVWGEYLESMIKDPLLPSGVVWNVIGDWMLRRNEDKLDPPVAGYSSRRQVLEQMGRWFLESEHRSNRQVFRELSKCVQTARYTGGRASEMHIANLADIALRDLEDGDQQGQQYQHDLLIAATRRDHGFDQARRMHELIEGWKWTNVQRNTARLGKKTTRDAAIAALNAEMEAALQSVHVAEESHPDAAQRRPKLLSGAAVPAGNEPVWVDRSVGRSAQPRLYNINRGKPIWVWLDTMMDQHVPFYQTSGNPVQSEHVPEDL